MRMRWPVPALAGLVLLAAACADRGPANDVVAFVDDYELSVDQVVDLLGDEEDLAADVGVVRTLADYWIDYTLLAEAVHADSTFAGFDLRPMVELRLWQTMVFQLRDSVIQVDTFITESDLEALYATEAPEVELRASHIMLTYPLQPTQAQRDSVRTVLADVRRRVVSGESFATLAGRFSQDPGSASMGGDLGFFRRGEMVTPFEDAAFALQPGQVSEIVETPMGLHLIRLQERRVQDFEEVAGEYRGRVQAERIQAAESTFVAALEERANPTMTEGAVAVVKEIARNPDTRLSGRASRRALIEWEGGEVTIGDVQTLLRTESPALRAQLVDETDETIATFLDDLARRDLLVREARGAGLQPPRERVDSMVTGARDQLREAARRLGLLDLEQAPGERSETAIARAVLAALDDNITGASPFVPLGLVGFQLRDRASFSVDDVGVGQAVLGIARLRAGRSLSPSQQPMDTVPDTVPR